jgi:hypothetical protein
VGRAKEKDRASQEETHKVKEDMAGLARQRVAVEDVATDVDATAEAGPVRTEEPIIKEVTAAEVITPRTTTDETAAEEVAIAKASSGQAGQGEPRETVEEAMEEASAGVRTLEPQEAAARASSNAAPAPAMETGTPAPGMEVDKAADPPHAGADAGPEKVSQETPTARTEEGDCGEASVTPGAAAKSASGGRTFMAPTGSSVGSQSSASQLQKEWADIAFQRRLWRDQRDQSQELDFGGSEQTARRCQGIAGERRPSVCQDGEDC